MIHLALRTEYSFRKAYAPIERIVQLPGDFIGIADDNNTYGHLPFAKAMKEAGKTPIFGVRLHVCEHMKERFNYGGFDVILLAKNDEGLGELYGLVTEAWEQFYYKPRLHIGQLQDMSHNIMCINLNCTREDIYFEHTARNFNTPDRLLNEIDVYVDDNNYINIDDRETYELMAGSSKRGDDRNYNFISDPDPQHVLSQEEVLIYFGNEKLCSNTYNIARKCKAEIPMAEMVKYAGKQDILDLSFKGAIRKEVPLDDPIYLDRVKREYQLIEDKGYSDYFLIVSDMIRWAKRNAILVGPSRGSSAGSLVCFLLDITEVDPIKHGLVFERFIDINRHDLPDIDIDFPDNKRDAVIKYLIKTYGKDRVAALANINKFKAKSAIGDFAACLGIPPYETEKVKASIVQRSGGDARAKMCILDTIEGTEAGKELIEKYPAMGLVANIEDHASHAGKHAAGIIVSTLPLVTYGGINARPDPKDESKSPVPQLMMDKKGAEQIDLLKIDVLGLRTLAILADACDAISMPYRYLYALPLDDPDTYKIFQDLRLNGVFQFEGQSLKIITRQLDVTEFNDLVAITSLSRPGALNSGGTGRYIKYRQGKDKPLYRSQTHRKITEESMGIVIYQEQMMQMAREIGGMSWKEVSELRRAASKSLGDEFFSQYKAIFIEGAMKNGHDESDARELWTDISATGSWTFNKSHAVSYGLISYWTAWFKAHHPLEFAIANLNHTSSTDNAIKYLRDLVKNDNIEYVAVDPDCSDIGWTVQDGKLIGGLTNIHGIGIAKARKIIKDRDSGTPFTPAIYNKLMNPVTDYDMLFPAYQKYGKYYDDWKKYDLPTRLQTIDEVSGKGEYFLIGKVLVRDLRDRNDYQSVIRRGGKKVDKDQYYMRIIIEDDTDSILCFMDHKDFEKLDGTKYAEQLVEGESWIMVQGVINTEWRMLTIKAIADLEE